MIWCRRNRHNPTKWLLHGLAELQPRTLATAHGSSFVGDGARALRELHQALWETFGSNVHSHPTLSEALKEATHGLEGHMLNM